MVAAKGQDGPGRAGTGGHPGGRGAGQLQAPLGPSGHGQCQHRVWAQRCARVN